MAQRCKWLLVLALAMPVVQAESSPDQAATSGELDLALRYRFEHVDQDGFGRDADASTLRARLTYTTAAWNDLSGLVELDAVRALLADNFNSAAGTSSPRRNAYPVVADPDYEEFNQLYLQYDGLADTRVRLGRQRILLDNQRFVGNVGWRQNEQTFDGFSVQTGALGDLTLFYSYIANVNRIFGDDVPAGDNESDTHLLNLRFPVNDSTGLTGYVYAIDNDDVAAFSTTTYGVRFSGKPKVADMPLSVTLEAARQNDAANNPADFSASYYNLQGTLDLGRASLLAGYEILAGSDAPGKAFRTPLATLHAFNGWADQFLATPDDGLEDLWIGVSTSAGKWSLTGVLHDFQAEASGRDFGNEIDLSASRKAGEHYSLLIKLARFDGDDPGFRDTTKLWFMASAAY